MEDETGRAYLAALRWLGRRALSVQEVTQRLRRRGVSQEAAAAAVARLLAQGALDDAAYARAYVHDRLLFHPVGRRGLQAELHRRGVPPEAAAEALAAVDTTCEEEVIRRLVAHRSRAAGGAGEGGGGGTEHLRLRVWLLRRGFSPEAVRRVLGRGTEEPSDGPEC